MPENLNPVPPQRPQRASVDAGHIPITEELDSARWTLPPFVPVLIALIAVGAVIAVVAYHYRPTPAATGSITKMLSSDQQDRVLVAVHLNFHNERDKPIWIKEINSEVETADGKKYADTAAPGVDLERSLRAAPELAEGRLGPLKGEMKIPAQATQTGMVIFVYPVTKAVFAARKSYSVRVDFYDNPPLLLKAN